MEIRGIYSWLRALCRVRCARRNGAGRLLRAGRSRNCARRGGHSLRSTANSPLVGLALKVPHMIFKCRPQIARGAPELTHHFPQSSSQFRKLFGAEHNQRHHKNYDQMWDAEHAAALTRYPEVPFLHHRRGLQACQTAESLYAILAVRGKNRASGQFALANLKPKRGRMERSETSGRGIALLVVVLVASSILGGFFGPTVKATAAGTGDLQDSVKNF